LTSALGYVTLNLYFADAFTAVALDVFGEFDEAEDVLLES